MSAKHKGTGRIFARGGVWYFRFRKDGKETTRTTGIEVGDDPKESKERAKAWAMESDEVKLFSVKDREMRLVLIKHMSQTIEEEIKDRIEETKRHETLKNLKELFKESPRRIDCSQGQLVIYLRYCDRLTAHFGADRLIESIGDREAEEYAKALAHSSISPNTYNKHMNGLKLVWNAITPSLGLSYNPWIALPRKKLDGRRRENFTDEELERILATAKGEVRTLIVIGLYTGMRMGDCARLKVSDVVGDTVSVVTSKTGAKVCIPLHPVLKQVLTSSCVEDGYFTPSIAQRYIRGDTVGITRMVLGVLSKCGIETSYLEEVSGRRRPLRGFHSLRHTFVSRCVSAGIPNHIVQALVGHASAKMTEHYTHLTDADFLKSFRNLK